jgi:hypothetical protein
MEELSFYHKENTLYHYKDQLVNAVYIQNYTSTKYKIKTNWLLKEVVQIFTTEL